MFGFKKSRMEKMREFRKARAERERLEKDVRLERAVSKEREAVKALKEEKFRMSAPGRAMAKLKEVSVKAKARREKGGKTGFKLDKGIFSEEPDFGGRDFFAGSKKKGRRSWWE